MKLDDLQPKWLEHEGRRVGIIFRCPHCTQDLPNRQWLSCFFEPAGRFPKTGDGVVDAYMAGDRALFGKALRDGGDAEWRRHAEEVLSCNHSIAWTRVGNDFGSLSVQPSINAEAAGHWHGHISNGQIRP